MSDAITPLTPDDLAVIADLLGSHVHEFQSYIDDPMIEGQSPTFFEFARGEVARVKSTLDKVKAMLNV